MSVIHDPAGPLRGRVEGRYATLRHVRRDLDLPRHSGLRVLPTQPWLGDAELAFLQGHAAALPAVIDDLDGGAAHDLDEVVDGGLSVLAQVEHGEQRLAVVGQNLGASRWASSGPRLSVRETAW